MSFYDRTHGLKRRRTDDVGDDEESVPIVRDAKWYKEDGDCVIQVQNTLFKVHKAFLTRDSSVFEGMFAIPQETEAQAVDGSSDDKPVVLAGDTVEEFQSLLWILYALPHQFGELTDHRDARFPELLTIAEMTNKYQFGELAAWCTKALVEAVRSGSLPVEYFAETLRVAAISTNTALFDATVSTLKDQLLQGSIAPMPILQVADQYHLREVQGAAYYAQLVLLQMRNDDTLIFPDDCTLSKDQRVRLLVGYWSLCRRWERLQRDSPFLPGSLHHAALKARWVAAVQNLEKSKFGLADVLKKLNVILSLELQIARLRGLSTTQPAAGPAIANSFPSMSNHTFANHAPMFPAHAVPHHNNNLPPAFVQGPTYNQGPMLPGNAPVSSYAPPPGPPPGLSTTLQWPFPPVAAAPSHYLPNQVPAHQQPQQTHVVPQMQAMMMYAISTSLPQPTVSQLYREGIQKAIDDLLSQMPVFFSDAPLGLTQATA